jgi:hypothetical protein
LDFCSLIKEKRTSEDACAYKRNLNAKSKTTTLKSTHRKSARP